MTSSYFFPSGSRMHRTARKAELSQQRASDAAWALFHKENNETGTHDNPIRYARIDAADPQRKAKRLAQLDQFSIDAKAGKVLCLSDLMINAGM